MWVTRLTDDQVVTFDTQEPAENLASAFNGRATAKQRDDGSWGIWVPWPPEPMPGSIPYAGRGPQYLVDTSEIAAHHEAKGDPA